MNINNINEAFSRIVKEEFDNQTDANKAVIYKENGVYKTTSKANYDAQIQDARKIQTLYDFESAREIMDYYNKYFNTTDGDFIILDECTNSLKEAPEKKERAPRRPKNICGSLENEVEMRLADELFTSFQKTPSWPFGPGYYDIENEMGVAREDGENGFRVFTVTTPVAKNRLGRAKEIAKEYGLKTEYVAPNNSIGKSNEMLKIYIPMDAPSPFDEKRMKDWEEKTKAFKSNKNGKLEESLEGNLTSDLYNAVADVLFKYKDYFDDNNSLKIYIKETAPYLVDKFFVENPNLEEDHIISEDTIKKNGKWVNKGKDGTHGIFKTKKAADAQRKAMFANGYKESKTIKESVSHSFNIGDTFKNVGITFIVDDIKGDYTLVHSDELEFMPYIVAWKLSDDGSWGQGHYFKTRKDAEEYLSKE